MLKDIKHTVKHTVIYSIGNISIKLIGFVLLPLYTSYLSVSDYGVLGILEITGQIITAVIGFRLSTAMMRWYNEKGLKSKGSLIFTTVVSLLFILVLFNLSVFPFKDYLSHFFFDSSAYSNYFFILFLSSSFEILNYLFLDLIRLKEKPTYYVILTIIKLILILSCNILFVARFNMGIMGILYSQLIGNSAIFFFSIPKFLNEIKYEYDFTLFKKMFRYSFPLIFTTIAVILLSLGDRYIIKLYLDYSYVGLYSLGYKIASIMNLLVLQSFQLGFLPIAFKKFHQPNSDRFFSKLLTYYVLAILFTAMGLTFFSKELIITFSKNPEYWEAYKIVPILVLGFVFKGMHYFFALGFHASKKTQYNAYIVFVGLLMSIGLNVLLVPKMKHFGSAYAAVITSLLLTLIYYYYSQKFYNIPYEVGKIVKMLTVAFLLYMGTFLTESLNITVSILIKSFLIFSFPFLLYIIGFYEKIEIQSIKGFIRKYSNFISLRKNDN